jgi:small neutral amino acid transporter SnatA (MarC family)
MNGVMVILAFVAAVNPFRARLGIPGADGARARAVPALIGIAVGAAILVGLAAMSGPALRALQVTTETFVIAAGLVAVLGGAWVLGFPEPADEPEASGWRAGLWPVAFPRVVGPETIALALAIGAREGVVSTTIGVCVGLGLLGALAAIPRRPLVARVLVWSARLAAALLILVGVWLMIEGIRDV